MGAVVPLLGIAAAAGGAAYVTKKVIDRSNTNQAQAMQRDMGAQIDAYSQEASRQRALVDQQRALAQRQADAYASSQMGTTSRRRVNLLPGVATSNLGATLGNVGSTTLLGN